MIILASKSVARKAMLENAGLVFETKPADIDEDRFKANGSPEEIATTLANEKALAVSRNHTDALVIGSDQVLEIQGRMISKAENRDQAIEKLKTLQGKTHNLVSAVSVVKNGHVLWSHTEKAFLTMKSFEDAFWSRYAEKSAEALVRSVGAYELEGLGSWLFSKVEGDYFTVLGLPLLPLLSYLESDHGEGP